MSVVDTFQGLPLVLERATGRRGSIRLTVEQTIVVRMPRGMSVERAMKELERRWPRMHRRLEAVPSDLLLVPRSISDGETIRVLDQTYRLRCLVQHRLSVRPDGDELVVCASNPSSARTALVRWIKARVLEESCRQANDLAARLGTRFDRIEVRHYRSRLGCCARGKILRFHWGIGLLPNEMFRTVIAHEVTHLKHSHHQKAFWITLESLVPDAWAHHKVMRAMGGRLTF